MLPPLLATTLAVSTEIELENYPKVTVIPVKMEQSTIKEYCLKVKAYIVFRLYSPVLLLTGCLPPTPDNYECGMPAIAPYGYVLTTPAYVTPIARPVGVGIILIYGCFVGIKATQRKAIAYHC